MLGTRGVIASSGGSGKDKRYGGGEPCIVQYGTCEDDLLNYSNLPNPLAE